MSKRQRSTFIKRSAPVAFLLASLFAAPAPALACSSCGCTLSSDWSAQGFSSSEGFQMDLRYDFFDQDVLRHGTGKVDRGSITFPNDQEIQQRTLNRNYTLALDYSAGEKWGVSVLIPYFDRYHTTILEDTTDITTSHTKSIGDVRVIGRYHGLFGDHGTGVQYGVKLPTGSFDNTFIEGPGAGETLDRGLQPGTGTTDLLLGIYHFGALSRDWDYFGTALLQQPLNSRDEFKPGTGVNVNFGVRYVANETVVPHVQINIRSEGRDSGANADVENSGATLVYLSPGVSFNVSKQMKLYGFVQLPIYQRVNGLAIEARYTVSAGVHYAF
jgi:hypothetical protein